MPFGLDSKHDTKMDSKQDVKEDSPPPYLDSSSVLTLTVDYAAWRRGSTILDPTGQAIFTSHTNGSYSTRLEVSNNRGQLIGTSKSSNWSSKIDVNLPGTGQDFEIHNSGSVFGGSPGYTSPAFNGAKVVWKNKAWSMKIIYTLIEGNGQAVARFESNPKTQLGKLELTSEAVAGGDQRMNEIVVTLLTLLQRKLRNIRQAEIGAMAS